MESTSIADESYSVAESSYFINFHRGRSTPAMSTGMSQVGMALTLFLTFFYQSTFLGFPFILIWPICEIINSDLHTRTRPKHSYEGSWE